MHVRFAPRRHRRVDVSSRAVYILKNLHVAGEAFRRESFPDVHLQLGASFVRRKERYALEVDRTDFVLSALADDKLQPKAIRRVVNVFHIPKFEVDVAAIAVKVRQLFPVIVQLIRLQHA